VKELKRKRGWWEYSTVGSAIALHVIGHEFESHYFQVGEHVVWVEVRDGVKVNSEGS
jgi:hypothetical protein